MTSKFTLTIENLHLAVPGRRLLSCEKFSLAPDDRYLIQGPSGCGKSTFLKVLAGLAPTGFVGRYARFRIEEPNGEVMRLSYADYRRQARVFAEISAVFQDAPRSLHPFRSIAEQFRGRTLENELLQHFKLPREAFFDIERYPQELSGGECQRLALLFSTISGRRVLLLDEPLTDIDHMSRGLLATLIDEMVRKCGTSTVLVTHDPRGLDADGFQHWTVRHGSLEAEDRPRCQNWPVATTLPSSHARTILSFQILRSCQPHPESQFTLYSGSGAGSLTVHERDAVALIGESGCGKSTILRAIAGLLPKPLYEEPSRKFDVCFLYANELRPVAGLTRAERAGRIQFVFQDTSASILPRETIGQNLRLIARVKSEDPKTTVAKFQDWAGDLQLLFGGTCEQALGKRLGELSVGELRRYSLIRAILLLDIYRDADATAPKLLLLDEISRGLDAASLECLVRVLRRLRDELNCALVLVSHDLGFVRAVCTQARLIFRGLCLKQELTNEDLANAGVSLRNLLNPYYATFLSGQDIDPKRYIRPPCAKGRCLVQRHICCPNKGRVGCVDDPDIVCDREVTTCC